VYKHQAMLSPRHSYSNSNNKKLSGPHEDILQKFAICTHEFERARAREREREREPSEAGYDLASRRRKIECEI
jgi:hypothetical protein